jgi:hypothetical protein
MTKRVVIDGVEYIAECEIEVKVLDKDGNIKEVA